ncbi:hypothetical protein VTN02DRAFT_1691 [Thermoascus thermophilus]
MPLLPPSTFSIVLSMMAVLATDGRAQISGRRAGSEADGATASQAGGELLEADVAVSSRCLAGPPPMDAVSPSCRGTAKGNGASLAGVDGVRGCSISVCDPPRQTAFHLLASR